MRKKVFTKKIIVATSQVARPDLTEKLYSSLKQDNVPFTFLVVFDGVSKTTKSSADIALIFKEPIHSTPEIFNCIFNLAKTTDAEFVMFCDNDVEFRKGSFKRMTQLMNKYDVISPVKIDGDYEKFKNYSSTDDPVEVIGCNDSVWCWRINKIPWTPVDRVGPFGFEDVALNYKLWRNGARFVVDPQAVAFHYGSQETPNCFTPEERDKYAKEWDSKRDEFLVKYGLDGQWFFEHVIMNQEGIKKFGYPVYIKER